MKKNKILLFLLVLSSMIFQIENVSAGTSYGNFDKAVGSASRGAGDPSETTAKGTRLGVGHTYGYRISIIESASKENTKTKAVYDVYMKSNEQVKSKTNKLSEKTKYSSGKTSQDEKITGYLGVATGDDVVLDFSNISKRISVIEKNANEKLNEVRKAPYDEAARALKKTDYYNLLIAIAQATGIENDYNCIVGETTNCNSEAGFKKYREKISHTYIMVEPIMTVRFGSANAWWAGNALTNGFIKNVKNAGEAPGLSKILEVLGTSTQEQCKDAGTEIQNCELGVGQHFVNQWRELYKRISNISYTYYADTTTNIAEYILSAYSGSNSKYVEVISSETLSKYLYGKKSNTEFSYFNSLPSSYSWSNLAAKKDKGYAVGIQLMHLDLDGFFDDNSCEYDNKLGLRIPSAHASDEKYCCDYDKDKWISEDNYKEFISSKLYKDKYLAICESNCLINDYETIKNLDDWGENPTTPANKITSFNSSVEGKTLDYCCDLDNYSEKQLEEINKKYLKLYNPTVGAIKIEAEKSLEKKCGPTTPYCGEDAYTKMKMVENNEILLSKAKTKIGAVEYDLEYCCEIDKWNFDSNEKFLPTKLATKSELEQLFFKVCNIPKKQKCTWDYLNQSKTRYYYKDGNSNNTNPDNISDCCDYNEIKDSLPNNMKITDFHQQQAYKDAGCGGCEYKVVNGEYKIVLTDKLKKQGKTEKYCCDNNENQWEGEDNPQYISFKKNTTYMAQLGCAQAACSWDKNKDEKTRYSNGVDCCVATNYETNDIINGLKKEGINISSNPTQSQIISKFKESTHYKNMKCNACTPESINSTNNACCTQPEMYDNSYRSEFRKYSVDEKEGLTKFLKANYKSIYESYCKPSTPECTIDTVINCPNCDTPITNGFVSGQSYDTVEYHDGQKDSTSINDINEDEKKCIVSENKFLNEDIGNKYCKVYCTEKIVYDYPEIVKSIEAGRKYPLGVASITTVKTCRINGIDEATFKSDLNAKAAEIKNAYDDYLKYKQAKKDAKIVTKAYDAKDKNNTCDCVNNASTTINGTTVSRNCCSQISTKISTVTTHTETLASTMDKGKLDMNTFGAACSQKNGRQSGSKCYYCDDGKKPNSSNKCEGPEVTSCSSPGSEYTLVNSTTCEYAYCSTIDNTKYGYQKVEKYEYGVDTKKTNQEGNICDSPENADKLYSVTYPKNEEEAWNKVNVLQGEFDAIIKQYKECFDIPNTILNLDDYDFNINVDYSQGDYSHSDKMEKSLVSSQVFEDDRVKSSNRISKSYGNIKVKVTRDKYNKEQLVIDNIYQGDLSKTIYSVSVQRQYKYVLTTGYTYINKGKPQSVTEKLKELQQIEVAAHLPVSYDYTEDGKITLSTTLDSDNARSDLALCTVDQNSDYELSCPFSVYDRLLLEPGGVLPVYRPIILSNPFPDKDGNGRNTGVNWCYENNCTNDPSINKTVYNYITNNRGRTEENVYKLLPLYTIKLTTADIQNIRNYNKATNYNDFRLICNNGRYCESIFLRGTYTLGYNEQSDIYKVPGVINDISNLVDKSRSCALNQNLDNCNYDDYFSASLGGD